MKDQRVQSLQLPSVLPHPKAIASSGQNKHDCEPEFWEFHYEIYRYLSRVPNRELFARYQAILRNMRAIIGPDRHVIPIESFLSSWYWYRKEHQTRYEFQLRELPLTLDPPCLTDRPALQAPARSRGPNAADVLFRFGKHKHMRDLVELGRIRISPAEMYREMEGDVGRQDDELNKHTFIPGDYARVTNLTRGGAIPLIGDIRQTVTAPNYYLLCGSCDWDPGFYEEFGSACVVIRDPEQFASRLEAATAAVLPGWYFHHNPVEYFDPYEAHENQYINSPISKDFRFAYQREYRWLWAPMNGEPAEGFIFLDLGPLSDIADLHLAGSS